MANSIRTGNRSHREQRRKIRRPELGYYLIVTDTEGTERCYFEGLRNSIPKEVQSKLVVRVIETKTQDLISKCLEYTRYDSQYRIPWIVFDRDQVEDFDEIIRKAQSNGIKVGWSNPCFEIWLCAYFGIMPVIHESKLCCKKFSTIYEKSTKQCYTKSNPSIYKKVLDNGNEKKAILLAEEKLKQCIRGNKKSPSKMCPATTVHKLVEEIRKAMDTNFESK